ncbi:hypothetical protein [Paenibacillus popilliae]|uniref:Biotin-(Acetyl-CoA carboxylase) ligase n=1 Tax=Paenibacillus popilliae ATCC 14706 TaxID=1212764 RepID=M9LQL1_PAEPP|nr:hypothetical protein [Paenibacillus popilliae]GAC43201.1 biotin-(acetyl-CoA carboxylase) ligase [Paenibacillus popilliae ATCC 14706]
MKKYCSILLASLMLLTYVPLVSAQETIKEAEKVSILDSSESKIREKRGWEYELGQQLSEAIWNYRISRDKLDEERAQQSKSLSNFADDTIYIA